MFTHVLVPCDPTGDAAIPLALACRIAVATNTRVTLICQVPGATARHDPRCIAAEAAARHLLGRVPSDVPTALEITIVPPPLALTPQATSQLRSQRARVA